MQFMNFRKYSLFIGICTAIILLSACQKDSQSPLAEAPPIPPQSTMLMDFSNFSDGEYLLSFPGSVDGFQENQSKSNWAWAASNVVVWNAITKITLAVPVAAFIASFQNDPQYTDDGRWLWTNTFNVMMFTYTSNLYAKVRSNKIDWEMYISQTNGFSDFLWYTGESDLEAQQGKWLFNQNPQNPNPLIEVTWHRDGERITDIKYQNMVPGAAENGSYIYFALTGDETYDMSFDLYNKVQDNHILVEWNRTNRSGRVKDALHFEDEEWHCWNENRDNIDCP